MNLYSTFQVAKALYSEGGTSITTTSVSQPICARTQLDLCPRLTSTLQANLRRLGAQVCGLFVEVEGENFARRLDDLLPIIEKAIHPDNYEDVSCRGYGQRMIQMFWDVCIFTLILLCVRVRLRVCVCVCADGGGGDGEGG